MINFTNSTFIKSASKKSERPQGLFPEVLIVGKSNVGKSSLLNTLCGHKQLAFTSSKPGHTRLLNYYDIDHKFYLVDAPGYGYARIGVNLDQLFGEMMEDYFSYNDRLKLVLILLDSRREIGENDLEIINFVKQENIPFYLVITKVDKINQSEKAKLEKRLANIDINKQDVYLTSALDNKSVNSLRKGIEKII